MNGEKKIQLKVANDSNVSKVAGAIVKNLQEGKEVELIAVGAGAVNQMAKACAVAAGYAAPSAMHLLYRIGFETVEINGEKKTAIKTVVEVH